jgi:hypothetical protein
MVTECPGYSDEFADRRCGNHHLTDIGNMFGGYNCCCGEPWLSDGCLRPDKQLRMSQPTVNPVRSRS